MRQPLPFVGRTFGTWNWLAVWIVLWMLPWTAIQAQSVSETADEVPQLMVLGTAQDAGYPQVGCHKACCRPAWEDSAKERYPACLAIIDPVTDQRWLLDCSWQLPRQLRLLDETFPTDAGPGIDGILLTHAHMGHYTGLMHLGREAFGSQAVPVFAMPRMQQFLNRNGPWSQLVKLGNIELKEIRVERRWKLNERIHVTPIQVPHRDEFSETVGFLVESAGAKALYLPDIDKWSRWERRIEQLVQEIDLAFLDATFFQNGEIPGRDMSEIPHPFVQESLLRFQPLPASDRNKIHFIHLNHTNPALDAQSEAAQQVRRAGLHLAVQGQVYPLTPAR